MALEDQDVRELCIQAWEGTTDVVFVLTPEGIVERANPAARRVVGLEAVGQGLDEMVDSLSGTRLADALAQAAAGQAVAVDATFPGSVAVDFIVTPTRVRDTSHLVAVGRLRELAVPVQERLLELNKRYEEKVRELATLTGKLRELATTDPLTKLFNRRVFLERGGAEWSRSERHGLPLSCLVVDLDRFKSINDRYGHHVGDEVLRVFGSLLRTTVRSSDIPARLGGEEFAAILPSTGEEGARLLAERVRTRLFEHPVVDDLGSVVRTSCSIGVASSEHGYDSFPAMLLAADTALYAAKNGGRDRVVVARGDEGRGGSDESNAVAR